jgi:hypothetical protein
MHTISLIPLPILLADSTYPCLCARLTPFPALYCYNLYDPDDLTVYDLIFTSPLSIRTLMILSASWTSTSSRVSSSSHLRQHREQIST